jgi:hypothetical protein
MVQDGTSELSYFIASGKATSLHDQLSQAPGGLAWDYLKGNEYPTLKVEWASDDRHILDTRTAPFSSLETLIYGHTEKSSISYTYVGTIAPSLQKQVYTEADLNDICATVFKNTSSNGVAIIHLIFITGSFTQRDAVGISFAADRIAIFGDTLSDTFLRVALAHETGHLLGLVAPLGLDSPYTPANASAHYDAANPPHCTSSSCLMRPTVSSNDNPCRFCSADMREIQNTTAPYTENGPPTVRIGFILVGAAIAVTLASCALYFNKTEHVS